MEPEEITVVVPRKERTTRKEEPTTIWPLVKAALDEIGPEEAAYDAAREALLSSDGCVVLANYLLSEIEHVQKADDRFKVPLLVRAAQQAREEGAVESIHDPADDRLYFETDDGPYVFPIPNAWTVDWETVVDRTEEGYSRTDLEERHAWALDNLLSYLDPPTDEYMV